MKPINIDTVAKNIVGWIYDFKNDHSRFPSSLDDLAENKEAKHSYNPQKAFQLNQKLGFDTEYNLLDDGSFKVTIRNAGKSLQYSSNSGNYLPGGTQ